MSSARLKTDIISHILSFLVPVLPTPMSGATKEEYAYCADEHPEMISMLCDAIPGAKTRDNMRANELAILMRTSIDMNHLASYHLYRTVITDSLPKLLIMHDRPSAHPHIQSKAQLLRRIRNLHIEYGDKVAQPSYRSIMGDPQYWDVNGTILRWKKAIALAEIEALELATMFVMLPMKSPNAYLLPNLRHLSVAAIFGAHERLQFVIDHPRNGFKCVILHIPEPPARPTKTTQTMGQVIETCSLAMEQFFRRSPLLHYCQRGFFGALSLPVILGLNPTIPKSTPTLFTFHLDVNSSQVRAAFGSRTRWLFENRQRNVFTTNGLIRSTTRLLDELDEKLYLAKGITDGNYKIEIFASSDHHHLPGVPFGDDENPPAIFDTKLEEEGDIVDAIWLSEDKERRAVDLKSPEGIVRWRPARESPACEACHWAYEHEDKAAGAAIEQTEWWTGK